MIQNPVAPETKTSYGGQNAVLMVWLKVEMPKLLTDTCKERILLEERGVRKGAEKILKSTCKEILLGAESPIVLTTLSANNLLVYMMACKSKGGRLLSTSGYEGKRSALMHVCHSFDTEIEQLFAKHSKDGFKGLNRYFTVKQVDWKQRIESGKEPMLFRLYVFCAVFLFVGVAQRAFFLGSFFL